MIHDDHDLIDDYDFGGDGHEDNDDDDDDGDEQGCNEDLMFSGYETGTVG